MTELVFILDQSGSMSGLEKTNRRGLQIEKKALKMEERRIMRHSS